MPALAPATAQELREIVADAAAAGTRLELRGGGSKAGFGAPGGEAGVVSLAGLAGIVDYDPPELVLTARAGTGLAEITALVAGQNQMLAFEPFDHGPIYGAPAGAATLGGVVAAGVAGSGRVSAGSARDHLLGFHAVTGRGEAMVGGARVVKNVTGYDLPKIMAGSWGRLAALTEVTVKVLPRPRGSTTLALAGLSVSAALAAMAAAMRSQAQVAAAAHLPAGGALTVFRLDGFGPSVAARCAMLQAVLRGAGAADALAPDEAEAVWDGLRDLRALGADRPLWRINIPPSGAAGVVAALEPLGADWLLDWAGGLVWLALVGSPAAVRAAALAAGGHATLVRGPPELRRRIPAQQPAVPAVAALSRRLRRAFDPAGVFETGRFLDDADAD